MCTVTVHRTPAELLVTMNRDEMIARAPEISPSIHEPGNAPSWIAPRDSERGGTWMGVNTHGVAACLLNAYLPGESLLPDTSGKFLSRGTIIPALLESGDAEESLAWLRDRFDPTVYPSFTLLVMSWHGTTTYEWLRQGSPLIQEVSEEWMIRSSSGWDTEEVSAWREERLAEWREGGCESYGTLPAFHILDDPDDPGHAPLMKREWSATRSITQALVDYSQGGVDMRYWAEPTPSTREATSHAHLPLLSAQTDSIDTGAP